jgi:ankyrin repeat protein/truncated hemoglobin YjbI
LNDVSTGFIEELRHRGEQVVAYPGPDFWKALGGIDGVTALVKDLCRRIEQDKLLRAVFPHVNSALATPFFIQWFGGSSRYSDDLAGGLLRRHQHRSISPKAAAAWLRSMREALAARGLDPEPIMRPLARIEAGGDCNTPACDPMRATMACDNAHMGTGVSVTPLASAKKWQPALAPLLLQHGAIDDVFTAAWLGDRSALRAHLDRNPELVNAIDPADDFKEVSLLCHAVCSGDIDAIKLLIERGALVRPHSGKLLTLAVVVNRIDLVKLLIEQGADVEPAALLGPLDGAERLVADLLIAHGASLDDRGRYGLAALHYAARGGKLPLIQLLLDRGASPGALDENGLTPLVHLSKTRSTADPIPVMEMLVASGANVDARDENQGTLLMYFARQGKVELVRWLLANGADRKARNKSGKTAGEVGRAHPDIIRLLATS